MKNLLKSIERRNRKYQKKKKFKIKFTILLAEITKILAQFQYLVVSYLH